MKQTYTLENEIAMILDLLSSMIKSGNLQTAEADQIIKHYVEMQILKPDETLPHKGVVNTIMNYSKSLDVFDHPEIKPMTMIVN